MMRPDLRSFLGDKSLLLAIAAPLEAHAALQAFSCHSSAIPWQPLRIHPQVDLLLTGIGKANAAGAVARFLSPHHHGAVISLGIAGALPLLSPSYQERRGVVATSPSHREGPGVGSSSPPPHPQSTFLPIATSIAATSCIHADDGLQTPNGFTDCAAMGFPLGDYPGAAVPISQPLLAILQPFVDTTGPIATVSTCSGTNTLANDIAARTGAIAEAMEGAAVAHVAHRLGVPAAELRIISNTTGDRAGQVWDLAGALRSLTSVVGKMIQL